MFVYLDEGWRAAGARGALRSRADLLKVAEDAATLRVRPLLMTVGMNILGLLPVMFDSGVGSDVAKRIAAPMWGGLVSLTALTLFVIPALFVLWRGRGLSDSGGARRGTRRAGAGSRALARVLRARNEVGPSPRAAGRPGYASTTLMERFLARLERRFGRWAIPNLTWYLVGLGGLVFALDLARPGFTSLLMLDPELVLRGQVWRLITYLFIPPEASVVFILFALYFTWLFGTSLESEWGAFKYNAFTSWGCWARPRRRSSSGRASRTCT